MSSVYQLKRVQLIRAPLEEVWNFFSNSRKLADITPPNMHFVIKNDIYGKEMYAGQVIIYKVRPLFGIPVGWMTEITHVERLSFFVDEQRKGPYRLWHHQHHFKQLPGGVEMTDLVHYRLPLGILGNLAHATVVERKLTGIFEYRRQKIEEIFNKGQKN